MISLSEIREAIGGKSAAVNVSLDEEALEELLKTADRGFPDRHFAQKSTQTAVTASVEAPPDVPEELIEEAEAAIAWKLYEWILTNR